MDESIMGNGIWNLPEQSGIPYLEEKGYRIRPGMFLTNGATIVPGGVCFTLHSNGADYCELALFYSQEPEPYVMIPFPKSCRIGNVFSMMVFGIDVERTEYAYRLDGPYDPKKGLLFDREQFLLDPYARIVAGRHQWGVNQIDGTRAPYRGKIVSKNFDWGIYTQPDIQLKDLIIYELHVRGFTRHASSGTEHPGTFEGLREKIPYLKELGVNAVELMPIFEFDECRDQREVNGKKLLDYWGYNTVCFFSPNSSYVAAEDYNQAGDELKRLIREFHENGIEVFLDVVFNHTAEGNEKGPYISFKGMDNNLYYLLTPDGNYYNFSGCGNTLNCNNPIVNDLILECLRYWVSAYRIDGFRFDLASILGRNEDGTPMNKPPLLERLAYDPVLGKTKLIAEAWDAGGLYQVGSFPSWGRWSEWNGKYRDDLRRFLKGDGGMVQAAASRIVGSTDLYDPVHRGDSVSVNFITCHDGFTLRDLYSYNEKHNLENGWSNTDGESSNNSWNCGAEGETDQPQILSLRDRLVRNACTVLMASFGTPMMLAGDEFGNTQFGNNNAYCQDNEISWLDWGLLETHQELFKYFQGMIQLRKEHPILRNASKPAFCGYPLTSFHGTQAWQLDGSYESRLLGVLFAGRNLENNHDDFIFLSINMHWEPGTAALPALPGGYLWRKKADAYQGRVYPDNEMPEIAGGKLELPPRSVVVLIGQMV